MQELKGMGVALTTPFREDKSVDTEALRRVVRFQLDNEVDYLVVMGTTAEYITLSAEECGVVEATIIDENAGKVPLVLGIGGSNTAEVCEVLKKRSLDAYQAILSVSPFYNKPTQAGIYEHYKKVAENSPLPVILYNVPGRTASNMVPDTVVRLANDFSNIIGIKEAAGDLVQAMQMIQQTPKDFLVISGDDMLALPMTLAGGAGVISVIGGGFPKDFTRMIQLGLERKVDEAYTIHYKLMEGIDLIFEEGNPAGIKAIQEKQNLSKNIVRLPLLPATTQLQQKIDDFLKRYKSEEE